MVIRLYNLYVFNRKLRIKVAFDGIEFYVDHVLHGFKRFFPHSFWDEDFIGFVL